MQHTSRPGGRSTRYPANQGRGDICHTFPVRCPPTRSAARGLHYPECMLQSLPEGPPRETTGRNRRGFTLIELMIVIVIIGILSTIGIANFVSMQDKARYGACISHQRYVHEAAVLYAADIAVGTQVVNVNVLWGAGYLTQEVGECPSSGTVDWDDYRVSFVSNEVTGVVCSIRGAEHLYTP